MNGSTTKRGPNLVDVVDGHIMQEWQNPRDYCGPV